MFSKAALGTKGLYFFFDFVYFAHFSKVTLTE